ncbi:MAG: NAD(P)/FAD-dependent oxidoreductase [Pseudomonadota bacterium]
MTASDTHFDLIIVGAGLSGICAAWHMRKARPHARIALFEARDDVGGTWDLFQYPGVRSDSDMPTLGFTFRPWIEEHAIASGDRIKRYIRNTAEDGDILRHIRFGHRLRSADWSSTAQRWSLRFRCRPDNAVANYSADFLMLCTGYYDYAAGYTPEFAGREAFQGEWVHPQQWPDTFSTKDKRIAVIGSGATAVTLVPSLAETAAHVTMVQRTPSYIAEMPARDAVSRWAHRWLGKRAAHWLTRWKNILYTMSVFQLSRRFPSFMRKQLVNKVRQRLGSAVDVDKHFNPPYDPWDQRLCLAPDGDFFDALSNGSASVATGNIASFGADHLSLDDGTRIDADVIVCATGLALRVAGGARISVDGERVQANERVTYKGAMLSGVPNFAMTMGYTNASWTLKCELISQWTVRLLNYMDKHQYGVVCPLYLDHGADRPFIDLRAGYIERAATILPRQSRARPWTVNQNYFLDLYAFKWSGINDRALQFTRRISTA